MINTKKVQKYTKPLILIVLLVSTVALGFSVVGLNVTNLLNPGAEGAKCYLSLANFRNTFPSDWGGVNNDHLLAQVDSKGYVVNAAEKSALISHRSGMDSDTVVWSAPQLSQPIVTWHKERWSFGQYKEDFSLSTDIQSSISLQDLNANGMPANGSSNTLMINYPTVNSSKQNPDGSWNYTIVNQKLVLVPADFVIQFSIPSGPSGLTKSGWAEGDWQNVHLVFMLYWHDWVSSILNNLPGQDPYKPNVPIDVTNKYEGFNYVGGFPITAWMGGFNPVVLPQAKNNAPIAPTGPFDPYYYYGGNAPSSKISDNTLQNLGAKVQIRPDLTGHFIDLYADSGLSQTVASKNTAATNSPNDLETSAKIRAPDTTMTPIQYFYVDINELGTYAEGNIFSGWTVYYPSCYLRLHVVYGIYGTYTYLWTTKTQEQLQYPGFENRTVTITHTPGIIDPFGALFSNPLLWILLGLISMIVLIALLAIFAPGILTLASALGKKGAEKVGSINAKSKRRKRVTPR